MGAVQNSCAYVIMAILQNSKPVLFFVVGCSVTKLCPTLCDPMDCSMPGFPILRHLPEFAQTNVHWVGDAIQPSNPLLLLPSIFPSIRVFSKELALHIRWPKHWSFSISPSNEYSGLSSFRIDWFDLLRVQGILKWGPYSFCPLSCPSLHEMFPW